MFKVVKTDDKNLEKELNSADGEVVQVLNLEIKDKFDYVIIIKK